jgi:hypothetical protein
VRKVGEGLVLANIRVACYSVWSDHLMRKVVQVDIPMIGGGLIGLGVCA